MTTSSSRYLRYIVREQSQPRSQAWRFERLRLAFQPSRTIKGVIAIAGWFGPVFYARPH